MASGAALEDYYRCERVTLPSCDPIQGLLATLHQAVHHALHGRAHFHALVGRKLPRPLDLVVVRVAAGEPLGDRGQATPSTESTPFHQCAQSLCSI